MLRHSFQKTTLKIMALAALLAYGQAQASIALSGTRMVLSERHNEASITVRNDDAPVLVQSWLETNSENDEAELPFAITPALAQVAPNGQQILRILYAGGDQDLPRDRETVLWLNVQEIPLQAPGENQLQIAVRQRIKVFFRPEGLQGSAEQAPTALQWHLDTQASRAVLSLHNPSAYHVSMPALETQRGDVLNAPGMIAPGETVALEFRRLDRNETLHFRAINDYGSAHLYELKLDGATRVQARHLGPYKP